MFRKPPRGHHWQAAAGVLALACICVVASGADARDQKSIAMQIKVAGEFIACAKQEIASQLGPEAEDIGVTRSRILQNLAATCSQNIDADLLLAAYSGDARRAMAFEDGMLAATYSMITEALQAKMPAAR